jgi:hypothetical protein
VTIVVLAPEVKPVADAHQLSGDANSIIGLLYAPFQESADTQFASDLAHIQELVPKSEGRSARGHAKPAKPSESGDYFVG